MLTRKILYQWFLVVKLKSPRHHDLISRCGKSVTNDHDVYRLSCPHSWLYHWVYNKTRLVPHVEQTLLTIKEHLSSPAVFSGISLAWSLVSCVVFCRSLSVLFLLPLNCLSFDLRLLIILWYLRFTASDYTFDILDLRLLITPLVSSNFSVNQSTDKKANKMYQ